MHQLFWEACVCVSFSFVLIHVSIHCLPFECSAYMHMQKLLNFLFLCAHYCSFVQCPSLRAYASSANPTLTSHVTIIRYKALYLALWPWPPWFLKPEASISTRVYVLIPVWYMISYIVVILFSKRSKWDNIKITELTHEVRLRVMLWLNDIEEKFFCNQRCRPLLSTGNDAGWRHFSTDLIFKNQKLHPLLFNIYCWHFWGLHLKALASYSSHAGVLYLYFLFAQFCTCFT